MRNNNIAEQFLADIAKQRERQERINRMSDEKKRQLKLEQEHERECLNDVIEQATGSNPSWF